MSLVFGGLLWPLAWLWAYSKPVFYMMAYGTDIDESIGHGKKGKPQADPKEGTTAAMAAEPGEVEKLRSRVAELEAQVKTEGGPV